MRIETYIPKEDQELPNDFGVQLTFHDKSKEEFRVVEHHRDKEMYEMLTADDEFLWFPLTAIRKFKFDKDFSKIIELKRKSQKQVG